MLKKITNMNMGKLDIQPQANEICRISKGTRISGIVCSAADVRIDGILDGTLHTKGKLVIGETSKITGKVYCQSCDLWGTVEGDVFVEDLINMKSECHLTGSIRAPKVGIEVGSVFNGTCNIITAAEYNKYLSAEENLKEMLGAGAKPAAEAQPAKSAAK